MDGNSLDITQQKIEQLKALFPDVFSEGKLDVERLRTLLGEDVFVRGEHYELSWAGKTDARKEIQRQTSATLLPLSGSSNNSGNIFIEGENLEVLRVLQRSYFGKVKMVYIDPPYNTGNDTFIYPDDYSERQADYKLRAGITDEYGYLNKQDLWSKNRPENGRFHSNWLSMMYPRLYLARTLLRDDGVIFISIDDNELTNLKLVMDEIYGEENFISQIVIQSNKRGQTYKEIAKTHEYLLLYSKTEHHNLNELEKLTNDLTFSDSYGKFDLWELRNRNPKYGRFNRPNLYYPIYISADLKDECGYCKISLQQSDIYNIEALPINSEGTEGCWRWSREKISKSDLQDKSPDIIAKMTRDGKWNIYEKSRKDTTKAKSLWLENSVISEQGTVELGRLGIADYFPHPKPVELIKKCLKLATDTTDIVLDFFAGSGTTAEAVLRLNREDNGKREFILVQIPEEIEEKEPAYKAGYRFVSEISRLRINKVIENITSEQEKQLDLHGNSTLLGFSSYRLVNSNFKIWHGDVKTADIDKQLDAFAQTSLAGSPENAIYNAIVTELLLKYGYPLSSSIEEKNIAGCSVFDIEHGKLWIALERITLEFFHVVADSKYKPEKLVTLNNLFVGDNADEVMSNAKLQLFDANIGFQVI